MLKLYFNQHPFLYRMQFSTDLAFEHVHTRTRAHRLRVNFAPRPLIGHLLYDPKLQSARAFSLSKSQQKRG